MGEQKFAMKPVAEACEKALVTDEPVDSRRCRCPICLLRLFGGHSKGQEQCFRLAN